MEQITQFVLTLVRDMGVIGYWVAFLAALAETVLVIGLLLPGSTFLLLMGVLSGQGGLDLGDLLFFAIAGATLGDNINYYLGRKYGHQWLSQDRWFLKASYLSKAEVFFENHGGKSVLLGRFVPSVKELMPFIAGMAKMRRWQFLFWNLLGAIGWALQWILPGYIFSQSLTLAHAWLSRVGLILVSFVALFVLIYLLRWIVIRYGAGSLQLAGSVSRSIGEAIRDNPDVAAWSACHPRLIRFLKQRTDTSRIRGLPITLIALSMGYVLILFGGMVEDLLLKEAVVASDLRVDRLIASFRTPLLNHLFYGITTLGNSAVVIAGLVLSSCVLWRMRRARFILPMFVSAGFAALLTSLGKFAFQRSRPEVGLIEQAGYSFPSGHATISVAFYGFLFFTLIHFVVNWRTRINLIFASVLLIAAIGFSRIYLGVHYLSDVFAGYLVGLLGMLIGVALTYTGWSGIHRRLHRVRNTGTLSLVMIAFSAVIWSGLILKMNLSSPFPDRTTAPPLVAGQYLGPDQLFSGEESGYAISVAGVRKSPINLVIQAQPEVLRSCLNAAGWHPADKTTWRNVFRAYRDALARHYNPGAPLAPWFWQENPQSQQWSQPDAHNLVFDRHFLRIWATDFKTVTGLTVFMASTGHETLPEWHLIPQPDPVFDPSRIRLIEQLRTAGGVESEAPISLPVVHSQANGGMDYEGGRSVLTLSSCSKE